MFQVLSFYTFGDNAPDKNPKLKFTKGNNSKNIEDRVMVVVTALLLNEFYICVKFQIPSFYTFGDMLRTKIQSKMYKGQ